MGIFGWSYPPGAANDPYAPYNQTDDCELEEAKAEGYRYECEDCHAYLKFTPDKVTHEEVKQQCNGQPDPDYSWCPCENPKPHPAHEFVSWVFTDEHRICKRCGHDTIKRVD